MNLVPRTYVCIAQLQVVAPDPATAQEAIKTAAANVAPTLAAQTVPVTLSFEEEQGMPVLAET
jgi:hypothetical protein